jgi:creatinine amidohydrolase
MSLADSRWPELAGPPDRTLLVPLGSVEQHGPHLPLDVDTRVAVRVAGAAAESSTGGTLLLAPALAFGASGEHETFPGTVSIGTETLRVLLVEFGRSACRWARRVVFVNGHGGNLEALRDAVALLRAEGRDAAWFGCRVAGGDAHAGRTETSIMLALDPAVVRPERARRGNTTPLAELMPAMRAGSVRAVSPSGVLGDPTGASAAEGHDVLTAITAALTAALARWTPAPDGELRTAS